MKIQKITNVQISCKVAWNIVPIRSIDITISIIKILIYNYSM